MPIMNISCNAFVVLNLFFYIVYSNSQTIYLYDALLNAYHNLSNGAYNFTTNAAVIENRFSLVFTTNSTILTKEATESDVRVFAQNGMIKVASKGKKIVNVEVFDIYTANTSGVSIAKKEKIHALETELYISNLYRLLSVKVQLEDGSIITKKIMK